jgi:acetyltransferase-like isoleucine patch superfamily enzyme
LSRVREKLRWLPFTIGYKYGPLVMSRLRRWWVMARHPHANIRIHPTAYLGPGFSLHIPGPGTFEAGRYTQFRRGFRAEIEGTGRISFGDGCVCTYDVLIQCSTSIDIEDEVVLAQSCFLVDGNHRFRDPDVPMLKQGYDFKPLRISRGVAVMSKCSLLADIGERAFIGANSLVSRPIPPYCVAVGAPAKVIDYFGPPGGEPPELAERLKAGSNGESA